MHRRYMTHPCLAPHDGCAPSDLPSFRHPDCCGLPGPVRDHAQAGLGLAGNGLLVSLGGLLFAAAQVLRQALVQRPGYPEATREPALKGLVVREQEDRTSLCDFMFPAGFALFPPPRGGGGEERRVPRFHDMIPPMLLSTSSLSTSWLRFAVSADALYTAVSDPTSSTPCPCRVTSTYDGLAGRIRELEDGCRRAVQPTDDHRRRPWSHVSAVQGGGDGRCEDGLEGGLV